MATASEIIAARKNAGISIDPRVTEVLGNTPGLTEELYTNNVLDSLGNSYPWLTQKLERADEPSIPDYSSVIGLLGIKDDENGRTALEKFVEDFPKKQAEWKKKALKKDSTLGEKGWNTVKEIWTQTSLDKMNADIAAERKRILDGGENISLFGHEVPYSKPAAWAAGKLMDIFTPRRKKAFDEGRDPTASETLMDVAQNAAYAVPMGGAEAAIARGLLGSTAAKVAGTVGSAAIAPSAITALDYGLGTKDYAGLGDAAIDAGLGTATNLGVNKVIAPMAGALLNVGKVRGTVPGWLREFLENNSSPKQKGLDLVNEAKTKIKLHNKETDAQFLDKTMRGQTPDRLTPEQLQSYSDIIKVGELAKNKGAVDEFTEGLNIHRALAKAQPETKHSVADIIDNSFLDGAPDYAKRAMVKNPELIALMEKRGLKDYAKDPYTYVDVLKSYVTNEMGNDAAAQRALSRFGVDPKDLRKEQDEGRTKKKASFSASKILGGSRGPLSEESDMFLQDIAKNPEIMKTGYSDQKKNDAFKIWLLTEGNDLLRGTPAARPTWDVK